MLQPQIKKCRRVLITGAAGFIGAALVREMLAAGWQVSGLDDFSSGWPGRLPQHSEFDFFETDVAQPRGLERILASRRFDVLVHLAARVGVKAVLRDPEGCRSANLRGVREILRGVQALAAPERPRVLAASSSEVYAPSREPLRETHPTRSTSGVGRWAYAASKLRGEQLLDDADLWSPGAAAVHLRFFNVVGPGQDSDSGMVLPTFVENALAGAPIPVHGDGAAQRTFAHVDEVARVLRELVEHPALPGGALNVGGGARTTIAHLAQLVRAGSALKSELHYIDPRSLCGANFEEVAFRQPDLARLSTLGVALPAMGLERIVQDSLERHAGLCRQSSANPALKSPPCASPAS